MGVGVHDEFSGIEACGFGEGVELFGGGGVGGAVCDFVAIGDGD